ncbi:hypothetical protein AGMMS49942_17280 [Spirochaetia bacterium]|nr:hypothetical protein AGMMS49942_17280 [Spirochaetia bacterium]
MRSFEQDTGINDIVTNMEVLLDIFERIEKRRIYFHIFYDGCTLGELNEAALLCFWIVKLNPFSRQNGVANLINAKIALHFLVHVLAYHAAKKGKKINFTDQIADEFLYAFRYRDLSKEAIMALAASLIY